MKQTSIENSNFVSFWMDGAIVDSKGERIPESTETTIVVFPSGYIGTCPPVNDKPSFDPLTGKVVFYPSFAEW